MATKFMEPGTDATGDLSLFTSTSGSVSSDTTRSRTGSRSIKCASGAGVAAYVTPQNAPGIGRYGFSFYVDALPSSSIPIVQISAGSVFINLSLLTTGVLQFDDNTHTIVGATGPVINPGQWYRVCMCVVSTSQLALFIDSKPTGAGGSGLTLPVGAGTNASLGWVFNPGASKNMWLDDIYIDDSALALDFGNDLRVTCKRPNGVGSANTFGTAIGATANPRYLNEVEIPISETNGWKEVAPVASANGIYGYNSVPGTSDAIAALTKRGCKFTAPADLVHVNAINAYLNRTASGSGYVFTAGIYADSSGSPGALVANSSIQLTSNAASGSPQWYRAAYGTLPVLVAGSAYWLCVLATKAGFTFDDAGASNQMATRLDTLPYDDPFGAAPTFAARKMGVYIEFDAGNAANHAETYRIEDDIIGDASLAGATIIARQPWIWAKKSLNVGSGETLFNNGTEVSIALTTASALYSQITDSPNYPNNPSAVGLRNSAGVTDTSLFECGVLIAYIPAPSIRGRRNVKLGRLKNPRGRVTR